MKHGVSIILSNRTKVVRDTLPHYYSLLHLHDALSKEFFLEFEMHFYDTGNGTYKYTVFPSHQTELYTFNDLQLNVRTPLLITT